MFLIVEVSMFFVIDSKSRRQLFEIFGTTSQKELILKAKLQADEVGLSRLINSRMKLLLGLKQSASNFELLSELQKDFGDEHEKG